jgi:hypothetical protein
MKPADPRLPKHQQAAQQRKNNKGEVQTQDEVAQCACRHLRLISFRGADARPSSSSRSEWSSPARSGRCWPALSLIPRISNVGQVHGPHLRVLRGGCYPSGRIVWAGVLCSLRLHARPNSSGLPSDAAPQWLPSSESWAISSIATATARTRASSSPGAISMP